MKTITMKPLLLALGLSMASLSAVGDLVASRTVLNNNDTAVITAKFPQAVSGDLYLATSINGTLYFFADQGKTLTKDVLPFKKNSTFDADLKVLEVNAFGIPANQYPLYQVVAQAGKDPLNFTNWVGGLAGLHKMNFAIGMGTSSTNDKNGDGFADDDSNHDGYRDGDRNMDGIDDSCSSGSGAKKNSEHEREGNDDKNQGGSVSTCTPSTTTTPVPVTSTPTVTPKPTTSPVPTVTSIPTVTPVPTTTAQPEICGSRLCLTTTTPTPTTVTTVMPTTTPTPTTVATVIPTTTPTPTTTVVSTSAGQALYISKGCSASSCHTSNPASNFRNVLSGNSLNSLKNAIRNNRGDMGYLQDTTDPRYASDADLIAIAAYLNSKR